MVLCHDKTYEKKPLFPFTNTQRAHVMTSGEPVLSCCFLVAFQDISPKEWEQINYKLALKKLTNFRCQSPIFSGQKGKGHPSSATLSIPQGWTLSTALSFLCQFFSDSRGRSFWFYCFKFFFHYSVFICPSPLCQRETSPHLCCQTAPPVIPGKLPLWFV